MIAQRPRLLWWLMWFGLLGAPLAWTVQFLIGLGFSLAACPNGSTPKTLMIDSPTIAATAVGATIAVLAGIAAVVAFRATTETDEPPTGRVHFLATVGIVVSPLFLLIILLSGITAAFFPTCLQS